MKGRENTRLKVQFFWPFKGDYYIIGLAKDYSWVLVGNPSRKYLWILVPEKTLPGNIIDRIKTRADRLGFDISQLKRRFRIVRYFGKIAQKFWLTRFAGNQQD